MELSNLTENFNREARIGFLAILFKLATTPATIPIQPICRPSNSQIEVF